MRFISFFIITILTQFLFHFSLEATQTQTQIITWENTEISTLLHPGKTFTKALFRTYNNGTQRVRINQAYSDSNAIKTLIKKRIVEPGESATIEVVFLSEGKEAGLYHNTIQVLFEGHPEPLATLHFFVTIPKLIECTPNIITWEESNRNQAVMVECKLDDRFVKGLSGIEYDKNYYKVSLIPDPSSAYAYTFKIIPIREKRPFNSLVKIQASDLELNHIEEPIFLFNSYSLNE